MSTTIYQKISNQAYNESEKLFTTAHNVQLFIFHIITSI